MSTMGSEFSLASAKLQHFLEENAGVSGRLLRYDGDTHEASKEDPHMDLLLSYAWYKAEHHGRESHTERGERRLARLTADELCVLVQFVQKLEDEIPSICCIMPST